MFFAHRVNTISYVYDLYYVYGIRSIEIDVQKTKDDVIVVYHDDISHEYSTALPSYVPTLEEFLRFIPSGLNINVEIKKYSEVGRVVIDVLDICSQYHHKYYFSSFDYSVYSELDKYVVENRCWHLQDCLEKYQNHVASICINKDMLPFISPENHRFIGVYDVESGLEVEQLCELYPFVNVWIVDFD